MMPTLFTYSITKAKTREEYVKRALSLNTMKEFNIALYTINFFTLYTRLTCNVISILTTINMRHIILFTCLLIITYPSFSSGRGKAIGQAPHNSAQATVCTKSSQTSVRKKSPKSRSLFLKIFERRIHKRNSKTPKESRAFSFLSLSFGILSCLALIGFPISGGLLGGILIVIGLTLLFSLLASIFGLSALATEPKGKKASIIGLSLAIISVIGLGLIISRVLR